MSKAFTREDDGGDDPLVPTRTSALPPGETNYVTPEGGRALEAALATLVNEARPAALAAVAASDDATTRRALAAVDARIAALAEHLANTEVVDPATQPTDRVRFGATVTTRGEDGRAHAWTIVGVDEADAARHRVSWRSPVARALLDAAVGDVVTLRTPRGEEELEVVAIAYGRDAG